MHEPNSQLLEFIEFFKNSLCDGSVYNKEEVLQELDECIKSFF